MGVPSPSKLPVVGPSERAAKKRRMNNEASAYITTRRTRRRVDDPSSILPQSTEPSRLSVLISDSSLTSPGSLYAQEHPSETCTNSTKDVGASTHVHEGPKSSEYNPQASPALDIQSDQQPDESASPSPSTIPCPLKIGGKDCGAPLTDDILREHFRYVHSNADLPKCLSACPFPVLEGKGPCVGTSEMRKSSYLRHAIELHFPERVKAQCPDCLQPYTRGWSLKRHKCEEPLV